MPINDARLPAWATKSQLYEHQIRNSAQYAMFAMDCSGTVLTWNLGVQELLGFSEEEWIGANTSIIFTPPDQAQAMLESEMKLAADKGFCTDMRWHSRKDGSQLFGHGYMTAIHGEDGSLVGFSKILSDETKTKTLQDALTESNLALEQFAYVVSHDLQEPLRTITSYTELIARKQKHNFDKETHSLFDFVLKGAKRMNQLIQDLLAFAKVHTEEHRPSSYGLDIDLETAVTQLTALIEANNAAVTHDPLPTIEVDQGQMVRLFQNLIGNGIKYAKSGVTPIVHVSAREEGLMWEITVQDNGIGIDEKDRESIFRPFKRLHSQGEYSGTGIGLPICQRIVQQHGGRIWVESKLGEGAAFKFTLPKQGKAPSVHEPVSVAVTGGKFAVEAGC